MRRLVVGAFISLDGVVQGPGRSDEDTEGGFAHGGWIVPYSDEALGKVISEEIRDGGALLLGRKTYHIFAAYWPLYGDENPIAAKYNSMPKYVASRTLTSAEWNNTTVLSGDVAEEVRKLKEQPGDEIQIVGSANLMQTLIDHDLIDEYRLRIYPVILGGGKRMFDSRTFPRGLKLTDSRATSTGITINTYERSREGDAGTLGTT